MQQGGASYMSSQSGRYLRLFDEEDYIYIYNVYPKYIQRLWLVYCPCFDNLLMKQIYPMAYLPISVI